MKTLRKKSNLFKARSPEHLTAKNIQPSALMKTTIHIIDAL